MRFFVSLKALLLTALIPSYSHAISNLDDLSLLPQGARRGLLIQTQGEVTLNLQPTNSGYFPPASTLKVITALASQLELGDQFSFETQLRSNNQDLALIFSGDPTLTTEHLKTLLLRYKQQKGIRIRGDIWLNTQHFTGYQRAVGWPWDSLGVCYSAPVSAVNIDGNCIQASIYTQEEGTTRVYVPPHYPIYVESDAQTVTQAQQQAQHCDLELIASHDNHYRLSGCLAQRSQPLPLKFAIQNTELYAQRVIYQLLNQLGMALEGEVKIGAPESQHWDNIATHQSEPLPQLLTTMLQDSDNLIADALLKTLGQKFFLQPGSFNNGSEALKQIIFARTGIDLNDAQIVDGSGLSRNNRIRLESMRQILYYLWQHDSELNLIQSLATAGESGTLRYRRSMRNENIRGRLKAKSGSLYGTHNMVGYSLDKAGKPQALFVQFITDYFPAEPDPLKPVEAPITRFEQQFYQMILNTHD
ncbi:serine-type D-Ala-D-Ala carboxypeptidase [Vibrio cincinnatiensis]|uniref:D-alanyl-D-alanine carboxypeptidase / D-alanyl-D-alanine-endopeptidase (Penicillin-binding protein 4) n=1 Tax=Vibrio cincinnatiensis DSM 19608 TaxID=1123491 RepID=A0A1T4PET8_VIBCI|nr:serine-type D-Ala-D-Ala carboxypeptidase [Vibrio cincinnatiensis]MCG3721693.1 serine-type D-Ala-D-Ala carboxypeptidase [Vibrio cincinnatiensis]MCG3766277.1 serine-type D-Ala-D-Ala carboxypeptidase [Vibrio cincinnatiensis]SJZ89861.1 D-alanyl-D-alanine carboxypeptidase / D-alanyl-D-alanine-endopeptidase (penicillin-binding protein 4) [Vibrio cincinnatiensis DSM 19608]SUP47754.1 D-alanyl-D-alanine carboxypeptidase/D-alanyl-D -alanine-endopeptidase [Vibrio cincinnatiensis]